jgi:hypothetical protein
MAGDSEKEIEIVAYQARSILETHCHGCHSGPRPRGSLIILDHDGLLNQQLVSVKRDGFSELLQRIDEGSMPPGRHDKLTAAERDILHQWHRAGRPFFPARFGEQFVLETILADVKSLDAQQLKSVRYVSLNNLVGNPDSGESLHSYRTLLEAALSSLPTKKGNGPWLTPLDRARTVFRVSLADLGWDTLPYDTLVNDIPVTDPLHLRVADLILLSYPYGTTRENSETWRDLEKQYLIPARQIRPIAYLRGDWLVGAMLQPPSLNSRPKLPAYPTADLHAAAARYTAPLTLTQVAAELGSSIPPDDLRQRLGKLPDPFQAALEPLLHDRSIDRRLWERQFLPLVQALAVGRPLWNVDAVPRPELTSSTPVDDLIDLTTFNVTEGKATDVVHPGDKWYMSLKNKSSQDLYVEVVYQNSEPQAYRLSHTSGAGSQSEKVNSFLLKPGHELRFPETGTETAEARIGTDLISILVSDISLKGAEERHEQIANRVVHELRFSQPELVAQKTYLMKREKKK